MKIVWKVADAPTGRYRSFERRGWPTAYYDSTDGKAAAFLECEDAYVPACVREGAHAPIKVVVLHHNHPEAGRSWKRFVLKARAATLDQAKQMVAEFLRTHQDWRPKA